MIPPAPSTNIQSCSPEPPIRHIFPRTRKPPQTQPTPTAAPAHLQKPKMLASRPGAQRLTSTPLCTLHTRRQTQPPHNTEAPTNTASDKRRTTGEKTYKHRRSRKSALLQNDAGQKPGRLIFMFPGRPPLGTCPGRGAGEKTPRRRRGEARTNPPPGGLAAVRNRLILPGPIAIGVGLSHASRAPGGARERRTAQ